MRSDARTSRRSGGAPPGSDARGFTLVEVVIAMTTLALVVAICYGAFHLGIRAVERGEVAVVAAQRAAEVVARRPAGSQTAAPMVETVVQLPIPAGPFAESTSSPSYSSTQ